MTNPETFREALNLERAAKDETASPDRQAHSVDSEQQEPRSASGEPRRSLWPARNASAARAVQQAFLRPKVRLTVLGCGLLLLAAFVVTGSAWTAPLAAVGILVLLVAWFGSRLNGRLLLEWGKAGATLEFKADITVPEHPSRGVESLAIVRRLDLVCESADVIESTATTVEIDIAELRALIALAAPA